MEKMYTWEKSFFEGTVTDPKSKLVSSDKESVYQEMKENCIYDIKSLFRARKDFDIQIRTEKTSFKINLLGFTPENYIKYDMVEIASNDPDRVKLEQIVRNMSDDDLIEFVNSTIDHDDFPACWVKEIDDDEAWDNLGKYLGGARLKSELEMADFDRDAVWFFYDSEGSGIRYFHSKDDILDYFGVEHLVDELACRQ